MIQPSKTTRETLRGTVARIVHVGRSQDESLAAGYGVIRAANGERYFFDGCAVRDAFAELRSGDTVTFAVEAGPLQRAIEISRQGKPDEGVGRGSMADVSNQRTELKTMNDDTINLESAKNREHNAEVQAVLRHTKSEYSTLRYLQASLLETLDWKTEGTTFSRKLSGVRHGFGMFCDHLDRIFAIEEHDGMAQLLDELPEYIERMKRLLAEHTPIRDILDLISTRLDRCLPTDQTSFDELQRDIRRAIMQLDEHMQRENCFIMDVFNTDVGAAD